MSAAIIPLATDPAPTYNARTERQPSRHGMKWLRLYSEARTDAKLRALTAEQFRVWFNLLCFASEQPARGMILFDDAELLAVEVADCDDALLTATIDRLVKFRILARVEGGVAFVAFAERQYDKPSDTPEETRNRKRRSRRPAATVTPMSRGGHANVTRRHDPDTDTEGDTEEKSIHKDAREPLAELDPNNPQHEPPTEQRVIEYGATIGKDRASCIAFYEQYGSQGWVKGNGQPMTHWPLALRAWSVSDVARLNGSKPSSKGSTSATVPLPEAWWIMNFESAADRAAKDGIDHHKRWARLRGADGKLWFCKPENLSRGLPEGFVPWE
jgi:hypothetical protein